MYSLEQAIKLFQEVNKGWCCTDAQTPTSESIEYINKKLGAKLPSSLVHFVSSADKSSDWFAGLGEDYQHPTHILNINKRFSKKRTKRRTGKWERDLPKNLIIINRCFDQDCNCIDLNSYDDTTGEYKIYYWHPNMSNSEIQESVNNSHQDFFDYISFMLRGWCNK
ncbi:MAG: SMI1/KNR4 family protein [Moraxellaceae bacterium]